MQQIDLRILLLGGLIIIGGFTAGKLFQKIRIPRVLGFIVIGLILGESVLFILHADILENLQPLVDLALGFIGFTVGTEFDVSKVIKGRKKLFIILMCEAMGTFALVTLLVFAWSANLYLALIFGALASATAPAATIEVIKECCAKGDLTQTILFVMALDNVLAVLLFSFVFSYVKFSLASGVISLITLILQPLLEIGIAVVIGVGLGVILTYLELQFTEEIELIILTLGSVILCAGLAETFGFSSILTNMALGVTMANFKGSSIKPIEEKLEVLIVPIFISFFVLTGAHLNFSILLEVGIIAALYIIGRTAGKILGSFGGARIAKMDTKISTNLGFGLLAQAGVALGLAYIAITELTPIGPNEAIMGLLIFNVIMAAVLIMEFMGPLGVKYAINRAGEANSKDIDCEESDTEIMNETTVIQGEEITQTSKEETQI
ncbi:cation:proton antiporter [Candidatus Borrarchaeum sp.]|uniref:cation:proton antiporter n=1 Tax=Candidatus Borrarchaeum sp. TaxID=2846742 RepID=UPI00257A7904|nr:cation:proton antiporter [Candidatus Borrarchaeum sp.]